MLRVRNAINYSPNAPYVLPLCICIDFIKPSIWGKYLIKKTLEINNIEIEINGY